MPQTTPTTDEWAEALRLLKDIRKRIQTASRENALFRAAIDEATRMMLEAKERLKKECPLLTGVKSEGCGCWRCELPPVAKKYLGTPR